jgi:hypothetical protein
MDGKELIPKTPVNETSAGSLQGRSSGLAWMESRDLFGAGHGKLCDHDII